MTEEIWIPVKGYEHIYRVSNLGRVMNFTTGKIMSQHKDHKGYMRVQLSNSGKKENIKVHRVVLAAFTEKSEMPIDHLNDIPDDNRLENLQYVSYRENQVRWRIKKKKLTGAYYYPKRGTFRSVIIIDRKQKSLGYFDTEIEAHEAYINEYNRISDKKYAQTVTEKNAATSGKGGG